MLDSTKEKKANFTWRNLDYKFKFAYLTTIFPIIVFGICILLAFYFYDIDHAQIIPKIAAISYLLMFVTSLITISICGDSVYKAYKSKDYSDFIPALIGLLLAFLSLFIMFVCFIAGALVLLSAT